MLRHTPVFRDYYLFGLGAMGLRRILDQRNTLPRRERRHGRRALWFARTRVRRRERRSGGRSINGLAMLIEQGAAAFEMWTGRVAPIEVMQQAISKHLLNG